MQLLLLLFYQTYGRFVLFGNLVFKLTMNNKAQKTRAAEVILHSAYTMPSWFRPFLVHREQTSDPQGPSERVCKLNSAFQLSRAPHCCLVRKTHHSEHCQISALNDKQNILLRNINFPSKIQINLLCRIIMCCNSFVLLANKKQFGRLCCDLHLVNGPFIPCCIEM